MRIRTPWLLVAMILLGPPVLAQVTVADVKYESTTEIGGSKLQLNGAGLRSKFVFKVYTAGLYLAKKAATPEEVLAVGGPKRVALTMLREVESSELGTSFSRGIEDNNDQATLGKLAPSLQRMNQIFAEQKKLGPGDAIGIDWIPGTGTLITVKGVRQGAPLKEPEFYNAVLRIWLGPQPVDAKLKDALLGKSS